MSGLISINHSMLHILDFISCQNTFASQEMDMGQKSAKHYVERLCKKTLEDLDAKRGQFAQDSTFAQVMTDYFADEASFSQTSTQIAQFFASQLSYMEKPQSTDVLVVDFSQNQTDAELEQRYLGIILLESKQAYMHESGWTEQGPCNTVTKQLSVLPSPANKISSYALVNLRSLEVRFQDKPRVISGQECLLIPELLLQCSVEASTKEAFCAVTELVEEVAAEYGANTAVVLSQAKTAAKEAVMTEGELDLDLLADEVFGQNEPMAARFKEEASNRQMPTRVAMEPKAVERISRNHKIVTDTGIEITFPAEYSKSPEYITFSSGADGMISIELKNITHIENR